MSGGHFGLIEAGGTKFVLGLADASGTILARHRVPTTMPADTIGAALDWFRAQGVPLQGVGIASFGPLDLNRASPQWGHVTRTPKPGWSGADLAGPFARAFACPVEVDTDVNGAALAESLWGAGRGKRVCLYLTIGTGVGGGAVVDGRILHGLSHPEMGHMRLPRHPDDATFAGACPFHGGCLEGLASGPAILARWGRSLSELPQGGTEQRMIAWYLAQAVCTFQAIMEPDCIVMGGGVTGTPGLLDLVRSTAEELGAGYFVGRASDVVQAPGLGADAGLMGAYALVAGVRPTS
ncbi:MAG: ROK family protein [Chakrabartia godavariana]